MEMLEKFIREIIEKEDAIIELVGNLHSDVRVIKNRQNIIDGDPILNIGEVCHLLNISERQVRRYKDDGKLTGFLLGGRRLYRKSEVDAFVVKMERCAKEREMRALGYYDSAHNEESNH